MEPKRAEFIAKSTKPVKVLINFYYRMFDISARCSIDTSFHVRSVNANIQCHKVY